MSAGKVVVTIRVEPEVREQLREHAYLTRETVNETVGRLITEYLAGKGQERVNTAAAEEWACADEDHRGCHKTGRWYVHHPAPAGCVCGETGRG